MQQVAAQIPWFHNVAILEKIAAPQQREWYVRQTVQYGWSRNALGLQIESRLFERQGSAPTNFAPTNFARTLPVPQSDLAQQILKDPYAFDFLSLDKDAVPRRNGSAPKSTDLPDTSGSTVPDAMQHGARRHAARCPTPCSTAPWLPPPTPRRNWTGRKSWGRTLTGCPWTPREDF